MNEIEITRPISREVLTSLGMAALKGLSEQELKSLVLRKESHRRESNPLSPKISVPVASGTRHSNYKHYLIAHCTSR
jgi:hypothetical protein